jgi:DNA-binding HxlR family transcriptional regulator
MGSVVHKCLETLGEVRLAKKNNKRKIKDEIFNNTLKELEDLEFITRQCFDYYVHHTPSLTFTESEYKKCLAWFKKALLYDDGKMDPRNQDIYSVEEYFDFEVKKDWAKYKYTIGDEVLEGYLSLKGTVDVIKKESENYFQILDYKTGKRLNWATGKRKEHEDFQKDPQLLLYYYALKNTYPDWDFYMSIYYINDGGVFDIAFDEEDYLVAENMIRQKFEYVRGVQYPALLSSENSHWKCQKLCKFSEQWKDSQKSTCQHIRDEVQLKGATSVLEEYGDVAKMQSYGSGGGVLSEHDKQKIAT